MLFRVNHKNFLLHMIDYFTANELMSFQYVVISSGLAVNGSEKENVIKLQLVYPSCEVTTQFLDDHDLNLLYRSYYSELKMAINDVFQNIVQPIVEYYHNIILINTEIEDAYTDVVVDFVRKEFGMPCVDLNELFAEGETELFYIDRKDLHDRNVKIARSIAKEKLAGYESNDNGKLHLIKDIMTEKEKLSKLKELGVKNIKEDDMKDLDQLLIEAWLDDPM